jgi:phosphatidylethanolamine-binding protein (PEBP) family uncharacterized protein
MRRGVKWISGAVILVVALVLAGCGSSDPATPTVAEIVFSSPAIAAQGPIPALYTCDGKDITPPLEWGSIPAGTGELALFALGFTPNPAKAGTYTATVQWAVAGISPSLHKLAAGKLPPGAHIGLDTDGKAGYSICPKKGSEEHYQFELYAVSSAVAISAKFHGLSVVAALANQKSDATPASLGHGGFSGTYKRRA